VGNTGVELLANAINSSPVVVIRSTSFYELFCQIYLKNDDRFCSIEDLVRDNPRNYSDEEVKELMESGKTADSQYCKIKNS